MLKPLVSKLCLDLFVRVKDIAEKQVLAKLKPIVGASGTVASRSWVIPCQV